MSEQQKRGCSYSESRVSLEAEQFIIKTKKMQSTDFFQAISWVVTEIKGCYYEWNDLVLGTNSQSALVSVLRFVAFFMTTKIRQLIGGSTQWIQLSLFKLKKKLFVPY